MTRNHQLLVKEGLGDAFRPQYMSKKVDLYDHDHRFQLAFCINLSSSPTVSEHLYSDKAIFVSRPRRFPSN